MNTGGRLRRSLAGACFTGTLAAGIVAGAAQPPPSPRLIGEAAPPAPELSLWYREPASDHPLLPLDTPRQSRQAATAEWVRALPVGNGRLGAMVFGGVIHERLQLNEDTLWAGRPYDPVNPEAKDALPDVRRLIAERKYTDAATLVQAKVMNAVVLSDDQRAAAADPVVRNLIPLIPHANQFDADGTARFVGAADARVDENTWTADLRHNAGSRDRLLAFFGHQRITGVEPSAQGTNIPGFGQRRAITKTTLTVNETHMEERVNLVGGHLSIVSAPGRGTTVRVRGPVNPHPQN